LEKIRDALKTIGAPTNSNELGISKRKLKEKMASDIRINLSNLSEYQIKKII
jgi:glycerol dehydrogenase-like iron-containing ADH family enzyme